MHPSNSSSHAIARINTFSVALDGAWATAVAGNPMMARMPKAIGSFVITLLPELKL
jgi:hypothetical protein